jgi:murein DD-endopeptidase MepM/ murein hydrolase activator NlpD
MSGSSGTSIHACRAGKIVIAGWQGGYGNAVVIDHGGGMATLYGHQSRIAVSEGQQVNAGDVIGYVGSTGMSTGPHLHFEVRISGNPVNPASYL